MCSFSAELASLTRSELMQKVRKLQNLAYQLGVEEGIVYRSCSVLGVILSRAGHHCQEHLSGCLSSSEVTIFGYTVVIL